jgi:hypothetical protein
MSDRIGPDAAQLLGTALGEKVLTSAPAAMGRILRRTWLGPSPAPPEVVEWHDGTPGYTRDLDAREREMPCVATFDRNASFVAGIDHLRLGHGAWTTLAGHIPLPETDVPGYWLIDDGRLPDCPAFYRTGIWLDGSGPRWFTTPLARLARELGATTALRGYCQEAGGFPLRDVAHRIGNAREILMADRTEAGREALAHLKLGYAAMIAWFEFNTYGGVMERPYWRRAIMDLNIANIWRAARQCSPWPFAWHNVDCLDFACWAPDLIAGLQLGTGIGQWKLRETRGMEEWCLLNQPLPTH